MEFKVMTFNLRVNVAVDGMNAWDYRVGQAAQIIRQSGADVVGIQEGQLSMLKDLERELPTYSWIGTGRRGGTEDEYCAIFYKSSKLTVTNHHTFWLSETPNIPGSLSWKTRFPRICTRCDFQFDQQPEHQFSVFNTHLDHISEEARRNSALLIWETMKASSCSMPSLLTGDFNAMPESDVIRFFRGEIQIEEKKSNLIDCYSILSEKNENKLGTYHAFTGKTKGGPIDYIFATPSISIMDTKIIKKTVEGKYPSDHFPVIARLKLP
jgi:endonuclease/exonuclease/phosphatase family metal-dependent hydrolase